MEADSQQDTPLTGYSIPIRAPLTLDSDSESCLSVNDHICPRTSSFNSTSSSIDVSSYSYEHSNILEHESSDLVAYPDEEIVFERCFVEESLVFRPFVRYPDGYFVKESCGFSDNNNFRAFVKDSCEESSSGGFGPFGVKLNVPIAPLTRDGDSDSDSDSDGDYVDGFWDDGVVQKVSMVPKVRSFNGDEVDDEVLVEGVFSGDDISGIENFDSVSTETVENEICEVECLSEEVKVYGSDASSFDLERVDALTVSSSNNEIESETKVSESDELNYILERIDTQIVSNAESEIENVSYVSTEAIESEVCEVKCMNEVVKLSVSDASSFDLERLDALTVSSTNNDTEIETKLSNADKLSFDSERIIARIVSDSDSEIENLDSVSTESVEKKGCEVESLNEAVKILNEAKLSVSDEVKCMNEVVKLSVSDASSFDLERLDALTVSSTNNETEIETKLSNADELSFDLERIIARTVSDSDSEIENLDSVSTESVEKKGCEVESLNEAVKSLNEAKLSEADVLSFLERTDKQIELISDKLSELDELSFDSERVDALVALNSVSEIENLSYASTESVENEAVKLSGSDESSLDFERTEAQTSSSSNSETEIETINMKHLERIYAQNVSISDSETEIKTINESKQEVVTKNDKEALKKMQRTRTEFLRLALNEQLTTKVNGEGGSYNFDFALTILAIGKTGVGKSATINSVFGENKAVTNAFNPGTTTIQEIMWNVDGVQLRVLDTPGLKSSYLDRPYNLRVLNSIKKFTRKHPPNVVLYVDRLDTLDVNDAELLKLITSSLGSSVWHSCIIALTHAGYDPSDEPSKGLVVQRCRFLQEQIVSFGGNNRRVANPVWLVDNQLCYKHDAMDLHCDLKGLVCLDEADEDDGCNKVHPSDALSEARNVINSSREPRDAHSKENAYRVKLVVNDHWFGLTWA